MALLIALLIVLISAVPVACALTYAMHCLLVVVQETAAGNDEVTWPAEPFQDSLGGAFHLVAIVLIGLAPFGILARALKAVLLPDDPILRFFLLAIPGLWLLFPVAMLSSLSGSSRWFVFRPVVVWNLLRLAPLTSLVYFISGFLGAIVAALAYVTVARGWIVAVPVTATATAAAFLIYGRLLGRVGGRMGRLSLGNRKRKEKVQPRAKAAVRSEPPTTPNEPLGPEELDSEWETTPYGQKQRRTKSYGLSQEPPPSDAAQEDRITAFSIPPPASITNRPPESAPTDFGRIIRARRRRNIESKRSFLGGVFTFPLYRQTRIAWLLLSLGFLVVYGAAYVIVSLYLAIYKGG